jgi:hypothetical protein
MDIRLHPEVEESVGKDVERSPYRSVEECVEQAVSLLHAHATWLVDDRAEISPNAHMAAKRGGFDAL